MCFPKGTKIIGHIVKVTSSGKGHTESAIFVQFDKAVMKDGQEILLNAGIQALAVTATIPPGSAKSSAEAQAGAVENDNDVNSDTEVVSTTYQDPHGSHAPAGSAAVALLVLSTIHSPVWATAYLLIFGAGTMLGMMLMTAALRM